MRLCVVGTVVMFALQPVVSIAEPLCPPRNLKGDPLAELAVSESDFTVQKATKAIQELRKDLPKQFDGSCSSDQSCFNGYEIVYYNAIKTLEGTLLLQQALLAHAEEKLSAASDHSPAGVKKGTSSFEAARTRLCAFISNEYYAD